MALVWHLRHVHAVRARRQDEEHLPRPDGRDFADAARAQVVQQRGERRRAVLPPHIRRVQPNEQREQMERRVAAHLVSVSE